MVTTKRVHFFISVCHLNIVSDFFSSQSNHLVSLGVKYIPMMCLTAYYAIVYVVLYVNLLTGYTVSSYNKVPQTEAKF